MLELLIAAVVSVDAAPSEAAIRKAVDLFTVCREPPFPQPQRDDANLAEAKSAYVQRQGGTAEAKMEIDVACVLYRFAHEDGQNRGHAVEREISPEMRAAIEKEIERQYGPVAAPAPSDK